MIKGWHFFSKVTDIKNLSSEREMGYCYAAMFQVMSGFYLVKIGATGCIRNRMTNIPRLKICCISPPHLNYYENEEILHKHFSAFRVPRKPEGKSQVELFNIDLAYFLRNLPNLLYETDVEKCEKMILPSGNTWYKSK